MELFRVTQYDHTFLNINVDNLYFEIKKKEKNAHVISSLSGSILFYGADFDYVYNLAKTKDYFNGYIEFKENPSYLVYRIRVELINADFDVNNKVCQLSVKLISTQNSLSNDFNTRLEDKRNILGTDVDNNHLTKYLINVNSLSITETNYYTFPSFVDIPDAEAFILDKTGVAYKYVSAVIFGDGSRTYTFKRQVTPFKTFGINTTYFDGNGKNGQKLLRGWTEPGVNQLSVNLNLQNGMKLIDVINLFLSYMNDMNYSNGFTSDGIRYEVDTINSLSDLSNWFIFSKSDLKLPDATEPSRICNTTLKKILDFLESINIYYYFYDHKLVLNYPENIQKELINFRQYISKDWTKGESKFKSNESINKETWTFETTTDTDNFTQFLINYQNDLNGANVDYNFSEINNDVNSIAYNESLSASVENFSFVYATENFGVWSLDIYSNYTETPIYNYKFSKNGLMPLIKKARPYKRDFNGVELTQYKKKELKTFTVPYSQVLLNEFPQKAIHELSTDCEIESIKIPCGVNPNCEVILKF